MDQSTRNRRVSQVEEFELISAITAGLPTSEAISVGLGDDAALLAGDSAGVLVCSDMMIEGRHFRRAWSSAEDIGHRAAAANLADIAAMCGFADQSHMTRAFRRFRGYTPGQYAARGR